LRAHSNQVALTQFAVDGNVGRGKTAIKPAKRAYQTLAVTMPMSTFGAAQRRVKFNVNISWLRRRLFYLRLRFVMLLKAF